ncbi:MAG: Asp23/Gls24 family envelope stress response protein [Anaerolineae bacterium]
MDEPLGKVTIAPNVLTTIVRQTTLEQPGVKRLTPAPPKMRGWPGPTRAIEDGIIITVDDEGVHVEVHIAAENGINLLKLGEALQDSIFRAIEEMLGMNVAEVNVYIDEVVLSALPSTQDS